MLQRLTIKNFALIKDIELEFGAGLTVITGETGAGKSLLITALAFLGGERVSGSIIRDGAKITIVEAEFDLGNNESLILRRELRVKGRPRAFINDSPAPLKDLATSASALYDITSQLAFSHLLDPGRHLDFLDQFSGLIAARDELTSQVREYRTISVKIDDLAHQQKDFTDRRETIEFQLDQFDTVNPKIGEEEKILLEVKRLESSEDLQLNGRLVVDALTDGANSAESTIAQANGLLLKLAAIDPELNDLLGDLQSAQAAVKEISMLVDERCLRVEYQPRRLEELRERLHAISALVRKFGGTYAAMIAHSQDLRQELTDGDKIAIELDKLRSERQVITKRWAKTARSMRKKRIKQAHALESLVKKSLAQLDVKRAMFEIRFKDVVNLDTLDRMGKEDSVKLSGRGAETAEFYFSANPGLAPKPLAQVASGGELSRLLLALKDSAPSNPGHATVIFDEIDTGVSGRIAHLLGRKLLDLSKNSQLIAITHLPQIASKARRHIRISKRSKDNEICVRAEIIEDEARISEIASMLSAGDITEAALRQAKNLIENTEEH